VAGKQKKRAYPYGSDYGKPGWSVKNKYGGLQKASISEICNVSGGRLLMKMTLIRITRFRMTSSGEGGHPANGREMTCVT
jgi:hypothetical protein